MPPLYATNPLPLFPLSCVPASNNLIHWGTDFEGDFEFYSNAEILSLICDIKKNEKKILLDAKLNIQHFNLRKEFPLK